jgi:hypothetical protein
MLNFPTLSSPKLTEYADLSGGALPLQVWECISKLKIICVVTEKSPRCPDGGLHGQWIGV